MHTPYVLLIMRGCIALRELPIRSEHRIREFGAGRCSAAQQDTA